MFTSTVPQDVSRRRMAPSSERTGLIIVGAGGHGRETASYIGATEARGEAVRLLGFLDDNKPPGALSGYEILGPVDRLQDLLASGDPSIRYYITAVGNSETRLHLVTEIESNYDIRPWTVVHPQAVVGNDVEVGAGSCIAPGSVVATDVRIGKHAIVNVNASLSHDTVMDDFVTIGPGAIICGDVALGIGCTIGAGATLIQGVSVGEWSVIGAGAVVIDDVPSHTTAVGVPARALKHSSS